MFDLPVTLVLNYYGAEAPPARAGWTKMRCPFHDDRKPSAAWHYKYNGFRCQGCGVKGNGITLIMHQEGVSYAKACELARSWFGDSYDAVRDESQERRRFPSGTRYRVDNGQAVPARVRGGTLFGDT